MQYAELLNLLQNIGKDPSRMIFEDELTGIYNRRFLLNYFEYKVDWEALQDHPLSLIMMDIDHFKQVNDTYGHAAGDQALLWVAGLLQEIAGDEHLAIRYAGDEFMILLPQADRQGAIRIGERLLHRIHEQPLRITEEDQRGGGLRITLSMGVASAPEDAGSGKSLIQQADTALYYAKKEGRDRLEDVKSIVPQTVFTKAALHQLEGEKIAGRKQQLAQLSDSLGKFNQGQNQFLIFQGAPGTGKTTFLEAISRNLAVSPMIRQAKVSGTPQEMFQPYYLTTKILVELFSNRPDKGVGILKSLNSQETRYLSQILPPIEGAEEPPVEEDERARREQIFNTVVHFLPKVIESQPLVLLIDDLDFADEASLMVLRQQLVSRRVPLLVCGTCKLGDGKGDAAETPLDRFRQAFQLELEIQKVDLTPLTAADIAEHLQTVFPQVRMPENFPKDLEQVTGGNPLFLNEILRLLVTEQKIKLAGQQWLIEPMKREDLPRSLESIISQKITALDKESRQLLNQASAFGEGVPLSLLSGSSQKGDAEILEFVDQAIAQGIFRSEFQSNDETIRFMGKQVQEITEESIQEEQKRQLHEHIGTYQETLYQKHLLPSAAPLAYHFQRSANQEKARTYEKFRIASIRRVFNTQEAVYYSGERRSELPPPGTPLDPASLAQVPTVVRCLLTALRNRKLYPAESEAVVGAGRQVKEALEAILEKNESLTLFQVKQALMVNGQRADAGEFKWMADEFFKLLKRAELTGIIFQRGLTDPEVNVLLEALSQVKPKMIDKDYWHRFTTEQQLVHLELKQVRYTLLMDPHGHPGPVTPSGGSPEASRRVSVQLLAQDRKLDEKEVDRIPDLIRALLNAAKNIKLYPLNSKPILSSIQQLKEALGSILIQRPHLILAQVSNSLLVNGGKVDAWGTETLVDGFLYFLDSISLNSLTFLENVSFPELKAFIGALAQQPPSGYNREFWTQFSKEERLVNILFDQVLYETRVTPSLNLEGEGPVVEEVWEIEPIGEELFDSYLKALPGQVNDFLIDGEEAQVQQMVRRLFQGFQNRSFVSRERAIETCRRVLEELTLALQHRFAKLLTDPLLPAFSQEKDPKILREIASLLHRMATYLIQFSEIPLASRVLMYLHRRHRKLAETKDPLAQRLGKIMDRKLEPSTQKLILQDLRSADSRREQNATLLLGCLGQMAIPLLLEVIKQTEDLRIRQIAGGLLAELGEGAVEAMKREMVLEGTPEERSRILEVADAVTRDLKTELAYTLNDENAHVRKAAFRLAENLNNVQVVDLLLQFAQGPESLLALEAIESLGNMKAQGAIAVLGTLLIKSKDAKRRIACCRALGQIADPGSIEPLTKIVTRKGLFSKYKKAKADVRAAAAFALGQIAHPRAVKILTSWTEDPDPRIREIAHNRLNSPTPASGTPSNSSS